jgi:hypothetical protein
MAHNNGMIPKRKAKGFSENAAKFRALAKPVDPAGTAYDPGPPENADSLIPPIGNLPLHGATGAELAGFVPHRPARPEKSEGGISFKLVSEYEPAGDQPTAIKELVEGVRANERDQVLLGVTGSGKTFTMAKVIEAVQRPALIRRRTRRWPPSSMPR